VTIGAIDHVAVVVRSIEASLPRYASLFGLSAAEPPRVVEAQRVRVVFLPTGPEPAARVELIQPLDAADMDSGVARFLATRGEGLHHVCFRSSDLPGDLAELADHEAELIDRQPRPGAEGQVAFVHPRTLNGVLWELAAAQAVALRAATAKDVDVIAGIRVASWQTTYTGIVPQAFLDEVHARDGFARRLASQLSDPSTGVEAVVAEIGGDVVGYAIIGPERVRLTRGAGASAATTTTSGQARGEVYAIYLVERAQGRGIGRQLLREAERRLGNMGHADAVLWMIEANQPARRFYERMGWTLTGNRQVHDLGADVPEIQFERQLSGD
jgi:methylmalonyl-CoA/ethylmalonyl-CoA epimerase